MCKDFPNPLLSKRTIFFVENDTFSWLLAI
nr:MAG TPA: hypothetical protein [Caudoviricetes sp.]